MADKKLTSKQVRAVGLLASGMSQKTVAEKLSVTARTVRRWATEEVVFISALNFCRWEIWETQLDRLRSLVPRAVDVLDSDLGSQDEDIRRQASRFVLRWVSSDDLRNIGSFNQDELKTEMFMGDLKRSLTRSSFGYREDLN